MTASVRLLANGHLTGAAPVGVLSGVLTAADPNTRTLTYTLLTYGEDGNTSAGRVRVRAGALTIPQPAQLVGNIEHDYTRPVARCSSIVDNGQTLTASFVVEPTTSGNDLLAEAASGLRTGASVELDGVTIVNGEVTAGELTGVGFVVRPAYPSATLAATLHPDVTPNTPPAPPAPSYPPAPQPPAVVTPFRSTAPAVAPFGVPVRAAERTSPAELIAATVRGDMTRSQLEAALADMTQTDAASAMPHSWIGEVWTARQDARPLIDFYGVQAATTMTYQGFRITRGLEVGPYAGDKAEIPSNKPTFAAVTATLARMAGGVDVDRAVLDLGSAELVSKVVALAVSDYKRKTEAAVEVEVEAAATAVDGGATATSAIVAAMSSLISAGASPNGVWLSKDAFSTLTEAQLVAFLSGNLNLGTLSGVVGGVSFGVLPSLTGTCVLASDRNAVEYREKLLEVSALDIARAGVDEAVYGYYDALICDTAGIVKSTFTPVVTPPAARTAAK